jgi:hypothetical protein
MTFSVCGTAIKFANQARKTASIAAKGAAVLNNVGNRVI